MLRLETDSERRETRFQRCHTRNREDKAVVRKHAFPVHVHTLVREIQMSERTRTSSVCSPNGTIQNRPLE